LKAIMNGITTRHCSWLPEQPHRYCHCFIARQRDTESPDCLAGLQPRSYHRGVLF
jgi:hypothetical protein